MIWLPPTLSDAFEAVWCRDAPLQPALASSSIARQSRGLIISYVKNMR